MSFWTIIWEDYKSNKYKLVKHPVNTRVSASVLPIALIHLINEAWRRALPVYERVRGLSKDASSALNGGGDWTWSCWVSRMAVSKVFSLYPFFFSFIKQG